jgi:apolipoprotein D and lipocalin family protein
MRVALLPSRDHREAIFWVLARQPDLAPNIRNRQVEKARSLGFSVDDLILVDHSQTNCTPGG